MNDSLPATTHLLYLHGFRSSPQSTKAQLTRRWVEQHAPDVTWWSPALPPSPRKACELILQGTADWPTSTLSVIGSSLGGFYANWLSRRRGCRAVVINPSIQPARSLAGYIGTHPVWQDPSQQVHFAPEFVDELLALQQELPADEPPGPIGRPQHLLAVLGTHDELLPFADMRQRYAVCSMLVVDGGDHALSGFEALLPEVMGFLGL
ncbi:MAG: hypothetical protein RJA69_997 [Pseudomonadota bacterium]|jgi:predicted esterase YcpF (UPF0227 family)